MTSALSTELEVPAIQCGCGCGGRLEPLSTVAALANDGWRPPAIARELVVSASYVNQLLSNPPRYLKGHWTKAAPVTLRVCSICGTEFRQRGASTICARKACSPARRELRIEGWHEYEIAKMARAQARAQTRAEAREVRRVAERLSGKYVWRQQVEYLRYRQGIEARLDSDSLLHHAIPLDAPLAPGATDAALARIAYHDDDYEDRWLGHVATHVLAVSPTHPLFELVNTVGEGAEPSDDDRALLRNHFNQVDQRLLLGVSE